MIMQLTIDGMITQILSPAKITFDSHTRLFDENHEAIFVSYKDYFLFDSHVPV